MIAQNVKVAKVGPAPEMQLATECQSPSTTSYLVLVISVSTQVLVGCTGGFQ
jgi:hypothetical protein